MKVKSFKQYLEKRLNKAEINEIEKTASAEFENIASTSAKRIRAEDEKNFGQRQN